MDNNVSTNDVDKWNEVFMKPLFALARAHAASSAEIASMDGSFNPLVSLHDAPRINWSELERISQPQDVSQVNPLEMRSFFQEPHEAACCGDNNVSTNNEDKWNEMCLKPLIALARAHAASSAEIASMDGSFNPLASLHDAPRINWSELQRISQPQDVSQVNLLEMWKLLQESQGSTDDVVQWNNVSYKDFLTAAGSTSATENANAETAFTMSGSEDADNMSSSAATSSTQASESAGRSLPRRKWDEKEERTLIDGLKELCANGWRADNGTFRHGYLAQLERYLLERHPASGIKGEPHVNSKLRAWKRNYGSISSLKSRSGLGFDYSDGAIIVDDPKYWNDFIKIDPNARGMNTKTWPLFKDWEEIFGKDRATGEFAEGPQDAVDEIERSQVHGISNNVSLEFPYIVDDEDEANAGQETNEPTREAEYAHFGPTTFTGASQNAYGGTQQAENTGSGPSAFPEASQGADGVTQRGRNQGTNTQTSSSKANEKEKCRKRKNTTEDDEKFLNGLMDIMKQFGEKQDTRMGTLVDKLGDRDHFEMRDEVLATFKTPAFKVFTAAQQIKASIWLTDDVKRMQVFLSRSELDRQTMVWMIINGEI